MSDVLAIAERIKEQSHELQSIRTAVASVIVGQKHLLDGLLIALLADGHVLLEGLPGLAKSLAVQSLAQAVGGVFNRIQFTPDLLPSDLTGTHVYNPKTGDWSVRKGPLFANFVLADEINRAPAKVQSALLEAMQERQVSLGGDTHALPDPFLVLATQNPVEQEGTYPLPEAQVDRFLMKLVVGYPDKAEEMQIIERMGSRASIPKITVASSLPRLAELRRLLQAIYVDDKVKSYVVDLVFATRDPALVGLDKLKQLVLYGASPRASLALTACARARAFLEGRGFVTPQDVKAVGMPVLRHRVITTYEAEAEEVSSEDILQQIFDHVPVPVIDPDILAQVRRIQVRTNRMVNDVMVGGYTSTFRGTGIEFDEVREFVEGDDPRQVDWNVTARTGRPHIKKFMEERELTVLFLLDASASMLFGTVPRDPVPRDPAPGDPMPRDRGPRDRGPRDRGPRGTGARGGAAGRARTARTVRTVRDVAAEFCACLALAASRNNDKAGLIAFTDRIERYVPAKKGTQHVLRLIRDILALETRGEGSDLAVALEYAARVQRKRSIVFVVSDFLVPDYQQPLKLLARRHDVVAVRIRDPKTASLPRAGLLHLRDPETGRSVLVDTSARRVRESYDRGMAAATAAFLDTLRRAGVDRMELAPDRSVADPIVRFFRMRELRGSHR